MCVCGTNVNEKPKKKRESAEKFLIALHCIIIIIIIMRIALRQACVGAPLENTSLFACLYESESFWAATAEVAVDHHHRVRTRR